jgi:DNA primase, eukaryotic-type, small subunit, putative
MDIDPNSRFLLKSFRKYYRENRPIMPERFSRREFGFMFFDRNFVQRHLGFKRPEMLHSFLVNQVPSHSYYSTAYYRRPDAPTMDEKTWLGADLIFDLDADHLVGADKMSYSEMLEQIKKEMINLVDSFLLGDLGFSDKDISIVFSGGRGYHAHVPVESVISLGSAERREIVDYVTCSGMNIDFVFPFNLVPTSSSNFGGQVRTNIAKDRMIPPADSAGWRLRMRNGLFELTQDICAMEVKDLKRSYPALSKSQTKTLLKLKEEVSKNQKYMFEKNLMTLLSKGNQELLVRVMKDDVAIRLSGEVDEPVTADIKRLIRLPNSVHGKSGLRVTPLTRNALNDFDPLVDAVPAEYSDDPVKVTMKRDYKIRIKGEDFSLSGETEVPEFAAVFLIGRKAADHGYLSAKQQ